MEWALAVVALALIAFGAVSRRVDGHVRSRPRSSSSGSGSWSARMRSISSTHSPTGESVKVLAEATLTVVLFADASRIDLRTLRREYAVPARLLGIGLPLTIAFGAARRRGAVRRAVRSRGARPRGVARPDRRGARPGRRHGAAAAVPDPSGPQRRERPQRRDLRAAPLHRAGGRGGGRRSRSAERTPFRLVAEEIGYGIGAGAVAGVVAAAAISYGRRRRPDRAVLAPDRPGRGSRARIRASRRRSAAPASSPRSSRA